MDNTIIGEDTEVVNADGVVASAGSPEESVEQAEDMGEMESDDVEVIEMSRR